MSRRRIGCLLRQAQLAFVLVVAGAIALLLYAARDQPWLSDLIGGVVLGPARQTPRPTLATPVPFPTPRPRYTLGGPTPVAKRVGILAGHYGPEGDPGAVCPDGLREVDINLAVAERVVAALRAWGHQADLLAEYDERLAGYRADVLLSIHADACEPSDATGFKIARVASSAIPEIEDALVECLYEQYGLITRLPRHDGSITPDMHGYHAFLEIDPQTPGAIIEIGFLGGDHFVLVNRPELLAQGIFSGLICFLER